MSSPLGSLQSLATAMGVVLALAGCGGGLSPSAKPVPVRTGGSAIAPSCRACQSDPTRYLRQLSLDLRGRPPSTVELAEVEKEGIVSRERIDAMLASRDFIAQAEEWHRALLWPTLDGFRIHATGISANDTSQQTGRRQGASFSPDPALLDDKRPHAVVSLADNNVERGLRGAGVGSCDGKLEYPPPAKGGAEPTYAVVGTDKKRRTYPYYDRDGVPLPYQDAEHCPNYCSSKTEAERAVPGFKRERGMFSAMNATGADPKPHELDPRASHCPDTHPHRVVNVCTNAFLADIEVQLRERREGFRTVRHYWSRGKEVRTCAYEAQDRPTSVYTGMSCAGQTVKDPSCGCGPDGAFCMPVVNNNAVLPSRAEFLVRSALNEEPLRIVASVLAGDEDYFDIFTTRRSFVTGPLALLYRTQIGALAGYELASPAAAEALPSLSYEDATWHEYARDEEHSGVLTTSAYLARFPTWRSRVSQFRTSFMCRPFTPGTASLPAPDDACTREPNLAKRCGCRNCHAALEPLTAYFGRWAERSAKYLSPAEYPEFDPGCQQCALTGAGCTARCKTHYVVDVLDADGARYAGTLRGYLYRTLEEEKRIDEGPRGLVASAVASGELSSCTARTTYARLMGRPMSDAEAEVVLPELVDIFNSHHHNYRELVRAIVTSPGYRRVD